MGDFRRIEITYDVPELKKCLFCIPLKLAVTVWGIIQVTWMLTITINAIVYYANLYYPLDNIPIIIFLFAMSILDLVMAVFTVISASKSNWQHMNICYNYTLIKIVGYVFLILVCQFFVLCCYSDNWFETNVDPIRLYFFRNNVFAGVLECLITGYMALVLRSFVQELGGRPHCVLSRRSHFDANVFTVPHQQVSSYDKQSLYTSGNI